MTETIQQLKEDITILQKKLQKLEELEITKTPIEILEAYKRWREEYPPSDNFDDWSAFRMGYHYSLDDAAIEAYVKRSKEEPEENEWKLVALKLGEKLSDNGPGGYYDFTPGEWFEWALNECEREMIKRNLKTSLQEMVNGDVRPIDDVVKEAKKQQIKDAVRESRKWCEENPDKNPLDCLKPQTPEQVADGLKEAFREAVKQGVVSKANKPTDELIDKLIKDPPEFLKFELGKTLTDLIHRWWEDVFTTHSDWDMETSIEDLVDQIQLWLPKEQSAAGSQSVGVEELVEGFNDCLHKIKRKLR